MDTKTKAVVAIAILAIAVVLVACWYMFTPRQPDAIDECTPKGMQCKISCNYGEESQGNLGCYKTWTCCKKNPAVETCLNKGGRCKESCANTENSLGTLDCPDKWACCVR